MNSFLRCGLFIAFVLVPVSYGAEEKGRVDVIYRPFEAALAQGTYTISFIRDGKIVLQDEKPPNCPEGKCRATIWSADKGYLLAPGSYDVRVEGVGAITVVKNGVAVNPLETRELTFDLKPGQGVRIIEYATGGLAREEIAVRIKQLEAAIQELKLKAAK